MLLLIIFILSVAILFINMDILMASCRKLDAEYAISKKLIVNDATKKLLGTSTRGECKDIKTIIKSILIQNNVIDDLCHTILSYYQIPTKFNNDNNWSYLAYNRQKDIDHLWSKNINNFGQVLIEDKYENKDENYANYILFHPFKPYNNKNVPIKYLICYVFQNTYIWKNSMLIQYNPSSIDFEFNFGNINRTLYGDTRFKVKEKEIHHLHLFYNVYISIHNFYKYDAAMFRLPLGYDGPRYTYTDYRNDVIEESKNIYDCNNSSRDSKGSKGKDNEEEYVILINDKQRIKFDKSISLTKMIISIKGLYYNENNSLTGGIECDIKLNSEFKTLFN